MDVLCTPLLLIVALSLLIGALLVGVVVLLKLGVITKYALKEEPPDRGTYNIDQSHEVDDG